MSTDRIQDVIHPEKMERRPDRIPDMRYSGGMSDATRRKGDVCVSKREKATWQFLKRPPSG